MNSSNTIIDFENIYVSYELSPVLKNINLKIKKGQHWVILGANGSGKSTLIKLISNDLYPNTKYTFSLTRIYYRKLISLEGFMLKTVNP